MKNISLLVGITGCNRKHYTCALLRSLEVFKNLYRHQLEISVMYVDNGSTEPGLKNILVNSKIIDNLVLNEKRDFLQDVWISKNQIIKKSLSFSGWSDPAQKQTSILLLLQDDVQIVNPHALFKSVIDFYRYNMNYMSIDAVRRVTIQDVINSKITPNTSPTTGSKYWLTTRHHLGTTGLFNPEVFAKIGLYPVDEDIRKFEGFTNCEDWMTARASQSGIIDVITVPHVPSVAAVWNDPRGMHCLVKNDRRCGHYIPPSDQSGLYYEMISEDENKNLESFPIPVSFNETARPIGWSLARDDNGDMKKFDRSRVILEGPFSNFDGSPWKVEKKSDNSLLDTNLE